MNVKTPNPIEDDMLSEYDFSGGIRGKHAAAYREGVTVTVHQADGTTEERVYRLPEGAIMLAPDVRSYFPDAETVNRALRILIDLIPASPAKETLH